MNKQQLASKIWESANKMRSKIEANEYKDYILGFIFYFQIRGNYEHGRWEGVSVEDILYSKMLEDGKLPNGAEPPHNAIYYDKKKGK